jgi:tetratricopeptide (TPR) repeat protein
MQTVLKTYPETPWKSGWRIASGPNDQTPFVTGVHGKLTQAGQDWALQLIDPEDSSTVHLFANGLSIRARRQPDKKRIDLFAVRPGLLYGSVTGWSKPRLIAETDITREADVDWLQSDSSSALLRIQKNRFVLVCGEASFDRALAKAEMILDESFDTLLQAEEEARQNTCRLFSVNPRYNPPVALAAEMLVSRLRKRSGSIHGLWSTADGFDTETFSLNELYPLIRAWNLLNPSIAQELMQTIMDLQQSSGGFPAWIGADGQVSSAAPWPLIAQSFELMWQNSRDPVLLKKHLPALRKYIQWAVRRFDPYRDRIPAWQSEQEVFVPGSFERGKATPELTTLLINELDAILRLCKEEETAGLAEPALLEERNQLIHTLNTVFWNPEQKAFSNVWKNGHYLHEPSFGSFMPLFRSGLDKEKQTALLESFEETHGFPGRRNPSSWKIEDMDDTAHRPAIHQFMAFEAIRTAGSARGMLMLFVHRAREGFATWFERESIEAVRENNRTEPAYSLGPVTAAFILVLQHEFVQEAAGASTAAQLFLRGVHRLRLRKTDLRIMAVTLIAAVLVHLLYNPFGHKDEKKRVSEASLNYQQGHYTEAFRLCRRYPDNPLANLLSANILMLAEQPDQAGPLYRQALTEKVESPSALLGLALSLQMSGNLEQAAKRYGDFIDIHGMSYPAEAALADEFRLLATEGFSKPPRWRRMYTLQLMNDLGL